MNQNKMLKRALDAREKGDLPYGFESRMMMRITTEAIRKRKRANVLTLSLVSAVSLSLIAGTILLLRYYFKIDVPVPERLVALSPASCRLFGFYSYIAFLALLLLGLDTWLRKMKHTSE